LKGKNEIFEGFQLVDKKPNWDPEKKINSFKNVFKTVNTRAATEG
jgi:hypothetical protein